MLSASLPNHAPPQKITPPLRGSRRSRAVRRRLMRWGGGVHCQLTNPPIGAPAGWRPWFADSPSRVGGVMVLCLPCQHGRSNRRPVYRPACRLGTRKILAGWTPRCLGECFALTMGQSPPGSTCNNRREGLPFFQGRTDFGFGYPENRKFCTAPTRIAKSGDALLSVRVLVDGINVAAEKGCIGRGMAALRHNSGSSLFTCYSAWVLQKHIGMYEHDGTVFGAINRKQFEAIQTLEPSSRLIETFDPLVGPLDCRLETTHCKYEL